MSPPGERELTAWTGEAPPDRRPSLPCDGLPMVPRGPLETLRGGVEVPALLTPLLDALAGREPAAGDVARLVDRLATLPPGAAVDGADVAAELAETRLALEEARRIGREHAARADAAERKYDDYRDFARENFAEQGERLAEVRSERDAAIMAASAATVRAEEAAARGDHALGLLCALWREVYYADFPLIGGIMEPVEAALRAAGLGVPGDTEPPPYVCPGCHTVAGRCAPGCIDAEIEADREGGDTWPGAGPDDRALTDSESAHDGEGLTVGSGAR